ncbi:metallophosphoesterase family protein [Pusillimonas sp.]|uniref:metallophosphoesterase family protein n=1 Tax=Pusillimonas sp. TaxID=3040095 RepID=UPI0029AB1155|nr:metallophosphoesterase family protein [Pusillimonas sp.]MDX3895329.1 metallophosphoesterase family protein [Pusillimonas sp.]
MKVALLSDIHANIYALKAVVDDLNKEGVVRILVAGDLVGYYYWPKQVVELLMADERFVCIRGNHENILRQVLKDDEAAKHFRRKYGSGYESCRRDLSAVQLEWLLSLPNHMRVKVGGLDFYLGHGSLTDTDEYIYPDTPIGKLLSNYSDLEFTVFGHTHYPFFHQYSGRCLLNPGSVGQPRDQGGLASYIIINCENRAIRFKRKAFDVQPILSAARENDPSLGYLAEIMTR